LKAVGAVRLLVGPDGIDATHLAGVVVDVLPPGMRSVIAHHERVPAYAGLGRSELGAQEGLLASGGTITAKSRMAMKTPTTASMLFQMTSDAKALQRDDRGSTHHASRTRTFSLPSRNPSALK
jgi:hypothetical protein